MTKPHIIKDPVVIGSTAHDGVSELQVTGQVKLGTASGLLKATGGVVSTASAGSDYAAGNHNHDGTYATSGHNHTGVYEPSNANIQSHISNTNDPHGTIPSQGGNADKFLKTNGTTTSWAEATGWLKATTIKTSAYNAVANDLVRANSTGGGFTVTLPTAPADGTLIGVIDILSTSNTNNITIARGGSDTIEGSGTSLVIDVNGATAVLSYNSAATNWKLVDTPIYGGALPSQTGNNGKIITTNGTVASWTDIKTINSASLLGTGDITLLTSSGLETVSRKTFTAYNKETIQVSATAATGTVNVDVVTDSSWYYTSNAAANWTFNIRGNAGTSLDSIMSTGQTLSVLFMVTQGGTAYYPTTIQIDGTVTGVTTKWQGGTAPTAGNVSSIDAYGFTVIKTGAATFTVIGSQTKIA